MFEDASMYTMDNAEESTMTTVTGVVDATTMKIVDAVNDDLEDVKYVAQEETTLKSKVETIKVTDLVLIYDFLFYVENIVT